MIVEKKTHSLQETFLTKTLEGQQLLNMRKNWKWFVIFGVILILIGLFAATYIFIASLTAILVFGALLLVSGIFQIAAAIQFKEIKTLFRYGLTSGILLVLCGIIVFIWPGQTAIAVTVLIGATFAAVGVLRIIAAMQVRGMEGWGWILALGILDLLIAFLFFSNIVGVALILPGFILACSLLFQGISLLMIGFALKERLDEV